MGFFKPTFCKFGHRQFFARGYIFWKGDNKKFIIFVLIFLNVFYAIINICIVLFGIHNENDRFLLMMKTVLFFQRMLTIFCVVDISISFYKHR